MKRTTSMVLGIIGGALAILWSLILVIGAVAINSLPDYLDSTLTDSWDSSDYSFDLNDSDYSFDLNDSDYSFDFNGSDYDSLYDALNDSNSFDSGDYTFTYDSIMSTVGTAMIFCAVFSFIAGVLGIVGGIIVNKRNTAAGVMMIIAAPLSLFGYFNIISMTLFIIGAVFALKKEKQPYPPYAPYTPYQPYQSGQYPPYPPTPYPQMPGNPTAPPTQPQAPTDTPAPPEQPKE